MLQHVRAIFRPNVLKQTAHLLTLSVNIRLRDCARDIVQSVKLYNRTQQRKLT